MTIFDRQHDDRSAITLGMERKVISKHPDLAAGYRCPNSRFDCLDKNDLPGKVEGRDRHDLHRLRRNSCDVCLRVGE